MAPVHDIRPDLRRLRGRNGRDALGDCARETTRAVAIRAGSLQGRLDAAVVSRLSQLRRHAEAFAEALALLDPTRVLARGYSIVRNTEGRTVKAASELTAGARVVLEFGRGSADAQIEQLRND